MNGEDRNGVRPDTGGSAEKPDDGRYLIARPKMSRENRAKQFAPFAALSGLAAALLAKEFEVSEAAETVRTEAEDAPP